MEKFLDKKIKYCPNCLENNFEEIESKNLNVYSELISKDLGISEKLLIKKMSSLRCLNCELNFWGNPLSKAIRHKLYTQILPIHPKGEDSSGVYFNFNQLLNKLKGEDKYSSKRKRILSGYLSSMKFKTNQEYKFIKNELYEKTEYSSIEINLNEIFKRGPKEFSRHSGFRDTSINNEIKNSFSKNKNYKYDYIEYGSLDWGPINSSEFNNSNCLHVIPNTDIFWNCLTKIENSTIKHEYIYEKELFKKDQNFNGSSLGLILIVDHLEQPYEFLKKFINNGIKSIFILLEKEDSEKGLPVQHMTVWNKKSLKKLAQMLNCSITFPKINSKIYIFAHFYRR